MKKARFSFDNIWSVVLFIAVMFVAFILPLTPLSWQSTLFMAFYTIINISAIFSLDKRNNYLFILFFFTLVLSLFAGTFDMPLVYPVSRGANIIFFLVIVFFLIRQIATAREVTSRVILDSFVGYLLLGIIFSIFVAFIMESDPGAFFVTYPEAMQASGKVSAGLPVYFSYVSLSTLGYGDVVPLKPYSRSLATLISISGQFYIAIIVALLVGKFAAKINTKGSME